MQVFKAASDGSRERAVKGPDLRLIHTPANAKPINSLAWRSLVLLASRMVALLCPRARSKTELFSMGK